MESMQSEKGRTLKVVNGFKFNKDKETRVGLKWRCTQKLCKAHIFTDALGENLITTVNEHNHAATRNLQRQKLSNSVKRKAMEDISLHPSKIFRSEYAQLDNNSREQITVDDILRIRHNAYKGRRTLYPKIPRSLNEVHEAITSISPNLITSKGEKLLLVNNETDNIIIFTTRTNLNYLCQTDKIFMDGSRGYIYRRIHVYFTSRINRIR